MSRLGNRMLLSSISMQGKYIPPPPPDLKSNRVYTADTNKSEIMEIDRDTLALLSTHNTYATNSSIDGMDDRLFASIDYYNYVSEYNLDTLATLYTGDGLTGLGCKGLAGTTNELFRLSEGGIVYEISPSNTGTVLRQNTVNASSWGIYDLGGNGGNNNNLVTVSYNPSEISLISGNSLTVIYTKQLPFGYTIAIGGNQSYFYVNEVMDSSRVLIKLDLNLNEVVYIGDITGYLDNNMIYSIGGVK